METYEPPTPSTRSIRSRRRRPAMAAALALGLVVTVGGVARAGDLPASFLSSRSSASYLTTNKDTVASSVDGALVDIVTTLGYQNAKAAGTGMILTSTGEILTNNHVINGATSIQVTVVATGRSYTATVVGTDPTQDVAVIQLKNASRLKTLPIGDSDAVKVGQKVRASGNAGGKGGAPSVVTGTVTALNQDITAGDEGSSDTEQLTGLIQTNAPIEAGDSGGPLAIGGKVVGMDTAASTADSTANAAFGEQSTAASEAYAIPIKTALTIANQIETGQASSTVHLGVHGFLGVELSDGASSAGNGFAGNGFYGGDFGGYSGDDGSSDTGTVAGALVSGVVSSGAAQTAGLEAGDLITAVNGTTVDSVSTLNTIMAATRAGQSVSVSWTDASGQSHTTSVTLGAAAAD